MTLAPGDRLGPYEVVGHLGSGGMGEVYRALDVSLKRDVALKVLPSEVAAEPERLARFQREAEVLASLNHPNIAHLYGIHSANGTLALVMELVDGPTLADRISTGPIPLDEALPLATQIAEAVEAAHERGIVHRDLKPANIKIRRDATVKVLDFGLARSLASVSGLSTAANAASSPTLTSPARITGHRAIIGTAAYMAPEQAKGDDAGKPADVWAFGCVLYEMLVGAPVFAGDTVSEVISEILKSEPDWSRLPLQTPGSVRRLLHRCLVKDHRRRLQHIGDARFDLVEEPVSPAAAPHRETGPHRLRRWLPWIVTASTVAGAFVFAARSAQRTSTPTAKLMRLDLNMPSRVEVSSIAAPSASIAPDGTKVAFTGQEGGFRRLYVRNLVDTDARVYAATDSSSQCYFSADGSAVAYIASDRTLARISLADGLTSTLARGVDRNFGASWGSDNRVTYVSAGALWQVDGTGGQPRQITTLDRPRGELFHAWPAPVQGGRAILFTVVTGGAREAHRIDVVDVGTGARRTVADSGTYPMLADDGPLVFLRDNVLVAASFDRDLLALDGPAVRLKEEVALDQLGAPLAALSSSGSLIYVSTTAASGRLVWVSRTGLSTPVSDARRPYDYPRLSPDGRIVSVSVSGDLWALDTARSALTRVTAESAVGNSYAVWLPDGKRVIFRTAAGMRVGSADGEATSQPIPGTGVADFPNAVTPDGKTLVFTRQTADASGEIYALSLEGDPNPRPVFSSPVYEGGGVLSPDGRWIAYASNESGRYEVYVRPFPDATRKWTASTDGGTQPVWSRDGRELFYRSGSRMMSVRTGGRDDGPLGRAEVLFDQEFSYGTGITFAQYDQAPDGRFLMIKRDFEPGRLNVVLNWTEELKRLTQTP